MQSYRKAVVAVVGAVVAILAVQGIDVDPTLSTAVVTLITAFLVERIPNA